MHAIQLYKILTFAVLKTYLVDISVNDVNDEAPQITNHPIPYQAAVETVSSIGTLVYQLSAYDPDTTADVKFYLEGMYGLNAYLENRVYKIVRYTQSAENSKA